MVVEVFLEQGALHSCPNLDLYLVAAMGTVQVLSL